MAEIIIEYDAKNKAAQKLIEFLMSSDIVKIKETNVLDEAIEDVKNGNITVCENFEEYEKITHELVEDV